MKAFNERRRKPSAGLVSSFSWRRSLAEAPASAGLARITNDRHDEHTPTGILTSDSNLTPAFPALRPVALWELVIRYSGATVPDFHGVPCHRTVFRAGLCPPLSKNGDWLRFPRPEAKEKKGRRANLKSES